MITLNQHQVRTGAHALTMFMVCASLVSGINFVGIFVTIPAMLYTCAILWLVREVCLGYNLRSWVYDYIKQLSKEPDHTIITRWLMIGVCAGSTNTSILIMIVIVQLCHTKIVNRYNLDYTDETDKETAA